MATKLTKPLRREVDINGEPHTLVVSDAGLILTKKRLRNGVQLTWKQIASMDQKLAP